MSPFPTLPPHLFVIFGANGDLSRRKLLPALAHLREARLLPQPFGLLGVTRTALDDEAFRHLVREALTAAEAVPFPDEEVHAFTLGDGGPSAFQALVARMEAVEETLGIRTGNRLIYLALPPTAYATTVAGLTAAGVQQSHGWVRLVIEKPFGNDHASAVALNEELHQAFAEHQIYRIDHYLGKETVQNLLVFRFANALFESVWNRDHIDRVEILVSETVGVDGRAQYYEGAGALRDMIQNHLMQILSAVAMEVPSPRAPDGIRDEKAKVLHAVLPPSPEDVVFGQYGPGVVEGRPVPGYREEPGVAPDSRTETFAAVRLFVDNWRWQGVPFILRTGKRLRQRLSRVRLYFRRAPIGLFHRRDGRPAGPNVLDVLLQPDEGFDLSFAVKIPGPEIVVENERLSFRYRGVFGETLRDAYETLLLDVMRGDQTLFVRADWAEASWSVFEPILKTSLPLHTYAAGSDGPQAADLL